MSLFNNMWKNYNLLRNPYFLNSLSPDQSEYFIGRKKEYLEIISKINLGEGIFLLAGDSGVGKTTLLNYVRHLASKDDFFTPLNEIEINVPMPQQQIAGLILESIYKELRRKDLTVSNSLMAQLENIYDFSTSIDVSDWQNLSYDKLKYLFKEVVSELTKIRFKAIILHFDNLDNVQNQFPDEVERMFKEIRDLLATPKLISFVVGNSFIVEDMGSEPRLRQVLQLPPINVQSMGYKDLKNVIDRRVDKLRCNNKLNPIPPHTDSAIKEVFEIHQGNMRETLKSLTTCVEEVTKAGASLKIDEYRVKEILLKKVKKEYLEGMTETDKQLLKLIMNHGDYITPTELAKLSGKKVQNIATKYLPKLRRKQAVELVGKLGRKTYYRVAPQIMWWKFQEKISKKDSKKNQKEINSKLSDFM